MSDLNMSLLQEKINERAKVKLENKINEISNFLYITHYNFLEPLEVYIQNPNKPGEFIKKKFRELLEYPSYQTYKTVFDHHFAEYIKKETTDFINQVDELKQRVTDLTDEIDNIRETF